MEHGLARTLPSRVSCCREDNVKVIDGVSVST